MLKRNLSKMQNLKTEKYISFEATVNIEHGLALTPSMRLVNNYSHYEREVYVINTNFNKARHTRLSSPLGILALNAEKGDVLKVFVRGDDNIAKKIAEGVNKIVSADPY